MRNTSYILILAAICLIVLSCNKDSDGNVVPVVAPLTEVMIIPYHTYTVTPIPTTTFDCTEDSLVIAEKFPFSGAMVINASDDFIPLCDGVILLGDKTTNTIKKINVYSEDVEYTYGLTGVPGDMAFDKDSGMLYVALAGVNSLARIYVPLNAVDTIPLSAPAVHVAVGNDGFVFVTLNNGDMALVDGEGLMEKTTYGSYTGLIAYDTATNMLFIANEGVSPSLIMRYAFDADTYVLTPDGSKLDAGDTGRELSISPDGLNLAFPCENGNTAGNVTIFDFQSADLMNPFGQWDTGGKPLSASFSGGASDLMLVASKESAVVVFDVEYHVELCSYSPATDYKSQRVRFSQGEEIVYSLDYNLGTDAYQISWLVLVTIE